VIGGSAYRFLQYINAAYRVTGIRKGIRPVENLLFYPLRVSSLPQVPTAKQLLTGMVRAEFTRVFNYYYYY